MFAVVVGFRIAPGGMARFLPPLRRNAAASLSGEAGCPRFDGLTDADRPDEVPLHEHHPDAAAFRAHLAAAHSVDFCAATADPVAAKDVQTYRAVHP